MHPGIDIGGSSVLQIDRCRSRMGSEDLHTVPIVVEVQLPWKIAEKVTSQMESTPDQCPTAESGGRHEA